MSTITHIHDPLATPEFRDLVVQAHAPANGVVVAVIAPGTRRDAGLFGVVLRAIGKTTAMGGGAVVERGPNNAAIHLTAWLDAEQVRTLILVDANLGNPEQLRTAATTATTAGVDLVLVTDGRLSAHHTKAISEWADTPLDLTAGAQILAEINTGTVADNPDPGSQGAAPSSGSTLVPATDFLTFRADARDLLPLAEFSVIDDLYQDTFRMFDLTTTDKVEVAKQIHAHVTQTLDPGRQTVIMRAIQAKAFTQGAHIDIDIPGLLGAIGPSAAVRHLTPQQWRAICSPMRPVYAAIAGLTAAGLTPETIST